MILRFISLSLMYLMLTYSAAFATKHVCSQKDSQKAESISSTAKSWRQSYQQFQRYAHCDDGAISEGFSESISILLAEQWQIFSQLEEIIKFDIFFRKFVIKHIDETIPSERLVKIIANSSKQCLKKSEKLCHDIKKKALEAISAAG